MCQLGELCQQVTINLSFFLTLVHLKKSAHYCTFSAPSCVACVLPVCF